MEKKLQKPHLKSYNLFTVQDLWQTQLSNLVDNLAEGTHKIECKYGHGNEKCET